MAKTRQFYVAFTPALVRDLEVAKNACHELIYQYRKLACREKQNNPELAKELRAKNKKFSQAAKDIGNYLERFK